MLYFYYLETEKEKIMSYPDVKTELDVRFGLIRKLTDLSFDLTAIERFVEHYELGIEKEIQDAYFMIDVAAMKIQDMLDAENSSLNSAGHGIEAAYGEDEPDYSDVEFTEKNPDFKGIEVNEKYQNRHIHSSDMRREEIIRENKRIEDERIEAIEKGIEPNE